MRIKATEGGGDISKLSEGAQKFYNGLNEIAEKSSFQLEIGLVYGEDNVGVGNYDLSQIDVADIGQFPILDQASNEQKGPTQAGKILHEVREQYNKQYVKGLKFGQKGSYGQKVNDHRSAISFENSVNGNERVADKFARTGSFQQFRLSNGSINKYYISSDAIQKVKSVNQ